MIRKRRPARDDKSIIRMIRTQLFPLTKKSFPSLTFNKSEIYKRFKKGETYVVRLNRRTTGFIHFYIIGKTVWIDMLVMEPKQRGKGWGSLLMQRSERAARIEDCDTAYLHVDEVNAKGQRFYQRLGYKEVNYEDSLHCYLYAKEL